MFSERNARFAIRRWQANEWMTRTSFSAKRLRVCKETDCLYFLIFTKERSCTYNVTSLWLSMYFHPIKNDEFPFFVKSKIFFFSKQNYEIARVEHLTDLQSNKDGTYLESASFAIPVFEKNKSLWLTLHSKPQSRPTVSSEAIKLSARKIIILKVVLINGCQSLFLKALLEF